MSMQARQKIGEVILFVVTLLVAVVFFFPILFNLMSAFKSNGEIMRDALSFPTSLYLGNFKYLLTETEFPKAIVNSLILTVVSIVMQILIIPMAGYAIERRNAKWTILCSFIFLPG